MCVCVANVAHGHSLSTPDLRVPFSPPPPSHHEKCTCIPGGCGPVADECPNNLEIILKARILIGFVSPTSSSLHPQASCPENTRFGNRLSSMHARNPAKGRARIRIDVSTLSHVVVVRISSYDTAQHEAVMLCAQLVKEAGVGRPRHASSRVLQPPASEV